MNQPLANTPARIRSTPSLERAKPDDSEALRELRRQAITGRINQLAQDRQLSSPACSVVMARTAGTPITVATEERIESMWGQITRLLDIKHRTEEDELLFDEKLIDLNDWVRREYGHQGLTCEELELAYNALVKVELTYADGRTMEAYPFLDTKHLGEVLAGYRQLVNNMGEVSKVLSEGLYLPQPQDPSPEQIDAFMEKSLTAAIEQVRTGHYYIDHGNALYTWLFQSGQLQPTEAQWQAATAEAQKVINQDLIEQKRLVGRFERRAAKGSVTDHLTPLRARIGKQLAAVVRREGDFTQRVRSEAFQYLLRAYLRDRVEFDFGETAPLAERPKAPDDDGPKPFSHRQYVESLNEQLPLMGDEQVSDLQRAARQRNVLDVYELATAEWNRRLALAEEKKQADKLAKQAAKSQKV